jgi:hypothetical protein
MKKFFKILLWLVLIIILILVLILGYFGFIPGISTLFGSNSPRDLGVTHTEADLTSVQDKLSQSFVISTKNPFEQLKSSDGTEVDTLISQEEYSAHLEQVHPIDDVQVLFEGDRFQMSGRIVRDRIPGFIKTLGIGDDVSTEEILEVIDTYLPSDPVFYISGTGSATNNRVNTDISKAEIGRLPVDETLAGDTLKNYIELILQQAPAFSADSITIEDGELHFIGTATKEIPRY